MSARLRLPSLLPALDDRALLSRFTEQHDQPAFEQLVKRHGQLVFGVCRRTVRDTHLAEDAFQAVFLVLARNPRGAAEAISVGGWLFGVARRIGLAARRQEQRREKREQKATTEERIEEAPRADFNDVLRVLDEELAAIPDESRAALVACFLEERTHDEAARELGWSLSTLRRRLDRGKELLRSRLARRGVTLAVGLLTGALASPARAATLTPVPSPTSVALATEALKRGIGTKLWATTVGAVLAVSGIAFGVAYEPNNPLVPPSDPVAERSEAPKTQLDAAPAPHAVAKPWVTVSGRIVFPKERVIPDPRLVPTNGIQDAEVWKSFAPLRYEDTIINDKNRGIANVVVWLRPDSDDRKASFSREKIRPLLVDPEAQEHHVVAVAGQFLPRTLAVRAGDRVTFTNRLKVPTNIRYTAAISDMASTMREFNVLVTNDTSRTSEPVPTLQMPDSFRSTVHPWMTGFVWAFDHPYFAVTDASGRFTIENAPAGKWRLVAWHEVPGFLGGAPGRFGEKITISESRAGTLELDPREFESRVWSAKK
ncbi:ECF RNA polymerase sigma factor SigE [Gemmata sp. SH-PL17]|uniref:sigma-70 family RNA polymerase sigma factor n=1 Tax=Gemmata sp. SH-PL17 TaxID=1630693 RepID=UPI00078C9D89|nr:sigma-70 family RNA polymerase sigma factor [Gemmata sp. SH-PL17]AMV28759.1 ECF RNA polymerase sigma factor SigE [Gemmata sp. SH-PL17]